MKTYYDNMIYFLVDPNTHKIRYIGMSTRGLERLRSHFRSSSLNKTITHKNNWIRTLIASNQLPIIRVIQHWKHTDYSDLCLAEEYWISYFKAKGCSLTNSEEWKKQASERHKGNKYNLGRTPWNKGNHLYVCKNGHEQVGANVYTYSSGKKKCRVCEKYSVREKRAADKEA